MHYLKTKRYGFYLLLSTIVFCISYVLILSLALLLTKNPLQYVLSIHDICYYIIAITMLCVGIRLIKINLWISLVIMITSCLCALLIISLHLNTYMWLLYLPVKGNLDTVYVTYLLQLLIPLIYIIYISAILFCTYKLTKKAHREPVL